MPTAAGSVSVPPGSRATANPFRTMPRLMRRQSLTGRASHQPYRRRTPFPAPRHLKVMKLHSKSWARLQPPRKCFLRALYIHGFRKASRRIVYRGISVVSNEVYYLLHRTRAITEFRRCKACCCHDWASGSRKVVYCPKTAPISCLAWL